jgi:hypothetical protein
MIDTIQNLIKLLSSDPLTSPQVAESLGKVIGEDKKHAPLPVQPRDSAFRDIKIMRKPNGTPTSVTLSLSEPHRTTLADLRATFGDYNPMPRMNWQSPQRVMFQVDIPGQPYTCAIFADVQMGQEPADSSVVTAITVRRDMRLE